MKITPGKILALLIVIGYVIALIVENGGNHVSIAKAAFALLLPLALIWLPEQLGSFTGYVGRGGNVNVETPAILISLMGWFFLIGLPALAYFLR